MTTIEKIKALMSKTIDNGCTEQEAMSAAEMVARLLKEHNLNLSEVEVKSEVCVKEEVDVTLRAHPVIWVGQAIATFTDTKAWRTPSSGKYVFFGLKHDVSVAAYMMDMIRHIMELEYTKFKTGKSAPVSAGPTFSWGRFSLTPAASLGQAGASHKPAAHGKTLRHSFMLGMAMRVRERLIALSRANQPTGTGIVLVKSAVVNQQYKNLNLKMSFSNARPSVRNSDAYNSGKEAGDGVNLNSAVGSKTKVAGYLT